MKKLIFLTITVIFQVAVYSQKEIDKAKSKADLFSEKAGTLVQLETTDIASLKGLDIKTITITDLLTNDKITAIRLEKQYASSIGSDTKIGTFDKDEVDAVLKTLSIIKSKLEQTPSVDYTVISYTSRGGVEVGCYTSGKKKEWSLYLKLEKYDSNSYVFLKKEEIDELTILFGKAKANL